MHHELTGTRGVRGAELGGGSFRPTAHSGLTQLSVLEEGRTLRPSCNSSLLAGFLPERPGAEKGRQVDGRPVVCLLLSLSI